MPPRQLDAGRLPEVLNVMTNMKRKVSKREVNNIAC